MSTPDVGSEVASPNAPPNASSSQADICLRSEAVQDLISRVPAWPVRVGNSLIFLCIALLLIISWFIQYPDLVRARATLTTKELPVRVVSQTNGRLKRLFVHEKESVEQNTHLAMLENPASYEDMLVLMNWAASVRHTLHAQADNWQPVPLPDGLSVGMVQDSYTSLQQRLFEYRVFIQDEYYTAKHQALHQQRTEYQQLEKTLTQQKSLVSEELNLTQKKLSRDSKLLKRGLLSPLEVEQSQATLLKKQYERASAQQALANNRIRLSELQRDLVDLEQQHAERARTLRLALLESYETLNNQLTVWQQTYLLQAPIAGRVSFFTTLHENQFVPASETVMAVVPDGGEIFGKVLLPQARSGKVKSGQRTRITLDSYPAAEFGTVEGLVEDISLVGQDQAYLIRITLPDGLRTRYSINLDFRQEMEGSAVIITEKIRLIERIFNWLHQALDQGIAP